MNTSAIVRRIWRFDWGSALIASPFAIALAWMITSAIDRTPPIIYESARVLTDSVAQGGQIEVEFRVFRHRICDGEAKRWLTDAKGIKHSIPSFTVGPRAQLAGLDTYRRTITIPEAAALGQAKYEVDIEFVCNTFQRVFGWPIFLKSPPIRFEVTPRPVILLPPLIEIPKDDDG